MIITNEDTTHLFDPSLPPITAFRDEFRFLSNFWSAEVDWYSCGANHTYSTVEHAYQAAKTDDEAQRELIQYANTPGIAKRIGRTVHIREGWEEQKLVVMSLLLIQKFLNHVELGKKLSNTGKRLLVEGNTWGDTFWGVDVRTGKGQNNLGVSLMETRIEVVRCKY